MICLPPRTSIAYNKGKVSFIDQRALPTKLRVVETSDWRVVRRAIESLAIRGAPLIGVAAALATAAEARRKSAGKSVRLRVKRVIEGLRAARPTAVNLFSALNRMEAASIHCNDLDLADVLETEAVAILYEDRESCEKIADEGLAIIPQAARILTICNTGYLATAGIGTALGVIHRAFERGLLKEVFALETRPLLQGARLTMWEMMSVGIPCRLLSDGAVGAALAQGIDLAIIGADRIARNGDTANKIGSLPLALACRWFGCPLFVAAPWTTFDLETQTGREIPIERRSSEETTRFAGRNIAPTGAEAFNPAFDVVEAEMISGFITDRGLFRPPYRFQTN